jgi:hypothetical protein
LWSQDYNAIKSRSIDKLIPPGMPDVEDALMLFDRYNNVATRYKVATSSLGLVGKRHTELQSRTLLLFLGAASSPHIRGFLGSWETGKVESGVKLPLPFKVVSIH